MTLSPISRRAGLFSVIAAVLIVLSQAMRLAEVGSRSRLGYDAGVQPRPARDGCPAARTDWPSHLGVRGTGQERPDRLRDRVPLHLDGGRRLVVRGVRDP
jgi:hypothetical protein